MKPSTMNTKQTDAANAVITQLTYRYTCSCNSVRYSAEHGAAIERQVLYHEWEHEGNQELLGLLTSQEYSRFVNARKNTTGFAHIPQITFNRQWSVKQRQNYRLEMLYYWWMSCQET